MPENEETPILKDLKQRSLGDGYVSPKQLESNSRFSASEVIPVIAAFACLPLGICAPLLFGLKGLGAWPLVFAVWLSGTLLGATGFSKTGSTKAWLLFAFFLNLLLLLILGPLFILAAMVST